MDNLEFRCGTCGSPHVSIPSELSCDSSVTCGRCGAFVATWSDYRKAISLVISSKGAVAADPVHDIPVHDILHE